MNGLKTKYLSPEKQEAAKIKEIINPIVKDLKDASLARQVDHKKIKELTDQVQMREEYKTSANKKGAP